MPRTFFFSEFRQKALLRLVLSFLLTYLTRCSFPFLPSQFSQSLLCSNKTSVLLFQEETYFNCFLEGLENSDDIVFFLIQPRRFFCETVWPMATHKKFVGLLSRLKENSKPPFCFVRCSWILFYFFVRLSEDKFEGRLWFSKVGHPHLCLKEVRSWCL